MKNLSKISAVLGLALFIGSTASVQATVITTGDLPLDTTAATPLVSKISATPSATIRFELGGANYVTSSGELSVSISVDGLVPDVISGNAADQMFRDNGVGAAYFGYYLTAGVKTASQSGSNVNIKIKKGSLETSGRSYYLLGNGTSVPTSQSDLTIAPASVTTFATAAPNGSHCGNSYTANGLTGIGINCAGGSTVANMDITQFVKVLDSDPISSAIVSQLEFIAVNE